MAKHGYESLERLVRDGAEYATGAGEPIANLVRRCASSTVVPSVALLNMSSDRAIEALAERIAQRAEIRPRRPLIVGLSGAQGSGKSTLARRLAQILKRRGLAVAAFSLDDVYLPRVDREHLARTVHPLLATRGVPGTHDVALAMQVLAALGEPGTVRLPVFDKAIDDRRPPSDWLAVDAPVDAVLFDGWCVGAVPQEEAALAEPVNALEREEDPDGVWRRFVNRALASDYRELFAKIDLLIMLAAPSFDVVYRWRLQQEDELRHRIAEQGGDGSRVMTERQLERFIAHYERLTRHMLDEMPARAGIVVRLDPQRRMTLEA
jgi:D-glycerate 3-kinase